MIGLIAGVDEAGRGPLAGEVCAAAVVLDDDNSIVGLDDSKKISDKKEESYPRRLRVKPLIGPFQWLRSKRSLN